MRFFIRHLSPLLLSWPLLGALLLGVGIAHAGPPAPPGAPGGAVVPEPSLLLLLAAGSAPVLYRARRRRRAGLDPARMPNDSTHGDPG